MSKNISNWLCCQIGARENYAIPRALHQYEKLSCLITDAWVIPSSPLKIFSQTGLPERFHANLATAQVHAFNTSLINFETAQKIQQNFGWKTIIARNQWFQKKAIKRLIQLAPQLTTPPILFSYSYAALELFQFAKQQGWYTVLGQIDGGISEEKIVNKECNQYPEYYSEWQPAPPSYWQSWQEECKLADVIMVNSAWSHHLLEKVGVESNKMQIIPLVYTPPELAQKFIRTYPKSFNRERPLRVLFLGQVILRKGIVHILNAVKHLEKYPIEFWIVGSQQIEIPSYFQNHPNIRWVDHVNRSETAQYYRLVDVFLFPTLSDGFGLTQLEAQAWQLPIIASRNCGEVVVDGVNGWLLPEINAETITERLLYCLHHPQSLVDFAKQSANTSKFDLSQLLNRLQSLII